MGGRLNDLYQGLIDQMRPMAEEHLKEMAQRVHCNAFPAHEVETSAGVNRRCPEDRFRDIVRLENSLRVHLGLPQLAERAYVEVAPGTTWESTLADFKRATHPDTSVAPFNIAPEVQNLNPVITPGVYEIGLWSDPSGEGDTPMDHVLGSFKERYAEAWLVPVIQWFAACRGTVYCGAMVPRGGDSDLLSNRILTFGNYQGVRLALDTYPERGAGEGPYVGAKFVG